MSAATSAARSTGIRPSWMPDGSTSTFGAKRCPPRCELCHSHAPGRWGLRAEKSGGPRRAQHASRRPCAHTSTIEPNTGSPSLLTAAGSSARDSSSCQTASPPVSSTSARMTVTPRRRSGRRTRIALPGKDASAVATSGGSPLSDDRISSPRTPHLDEQPTPSLRRRARERLRGCGRRADAGRRPARAAAHTSSRSPRRRPSAGSMPSSAAKMRYSASAFARSRPGRQTARRRTFFGVCSSSTNSITWTS